MQMYRSYLFLCDKKALQECLRSSKYSCSGDAAKTAEQIELGAIVFLLDLNRDALIGPFTAGETELEPGGWAPDVESQKPSANLKLEWEELHELTDAQKKYPFLREARNCRLSSLETQDLLYALRDAPKTNV